MSSGNRFLLRSINRLPIAKATRLRLPIECC